LAKIGHSEIWVMITTSQRQKVDAETATLNDPRWARVVARDRSADGKFWYSLATTGVYCRPSCPSRGASPKNVAFHDTLEAAKAAGFRACKRCNPDGTSSASIAQRIGAIDWSAVAADLDLQGWAIIPGLLAGPECDQIAGMYAGNGATFRNRVIMGRHGFGQGEYRYFAYPLPPVIDDLRTAIYPRLAPIANQWNGRMGIDMRFPKIHAEFLERCHDAGQRRPTPLLLQYGPGDYNCLHQDLYGEHVFPLQVTALLSQPGEDFEGGEFVLTEQRPRMQTRAAVVPLSKGDAVVFAVNSRPQTGLRGDYRVVLRHGVSKLSEGRRHTLGIIFHDAA
jgi:hypothetical protein